MKRTALAALAALTLAGCQDGATPFSPMDVPAPSEAGIVDARAVGGNPGFAFQPPLAPSFSIEGFDADVVTRVEVCRLLLADDETCDPAASPVWESEEPVPVQGNKYKTSWPLDESAEPLQTLGRNGDPATVPFYRVHVYAGTILLAYADIKFVDDAAAKKLLADDVFSVEVKRTLPVSYELNGDALLFGLIQECLTGAGVIDCDAGILDGDETVSVFTDEDLLAAQAEFPQAILDGQGDPVIFLLEHIASLTVPPLLPGVANFARATVYDAQGSVLDLPIEVDRFILCLSEEALFDPFLEIRRFDDGVPSILPSSPNTPECEVAPAHDHLGHAPAPAPSWGQRLDQGLVRLAGLFLPQPLAALHGGLNTTRMRCCSEFDAVLVEESAPFAYGASWEWASALGVGIGAGPFFTGPANCPYPTAGGTAGAWTTGSPSGPSNLHLTRTFQVPAGAQGIRIFVGIDDAIRVLLNGVDITATASGDVGAGFDADGFLTHDGCMTLDHIVFDPAPGLVRFGNSNTLEIVARDTGGSGYVDARVAVVPGGAEE